MHCRRVPKHSEWLPGKFDSIATIIKPGDESGECKTYYPGQKKIETTARSGVQERDLLSMHVPLV